MLTARLAVLAVVGLLPVGGCSAGGSTAASPGGAPVSAHAAGGGVAFEGRDLPLEQVLARCRSSRRPAMLYFATTWCGYCRKLERETLPNPDVGRHMAGYVNVEYGADAGVGKALAARYGVTGFPTLVRIDERGNAVGIFEGYDAPADFVRRIPAP
jgi:thioredoxin-related protein